MVAARSLDDADDSRFFLHETAATPPYGPWSGDQRRRFVKDLLHIRGWSDIVASIVEHGKAA
jgi:hypothetical protein